MTRIFRWLLVAILVASVGCKHADKDKAASASNAPPLGLAPETAEQVLAKVADRTITLGDFAAALERMNEFDRLRYQSPEKRKELLEEMIDLELLAIEAERRGLTQTPETQAAVRQIMREAMVDEVRRSLPPADQIPLAEVQAYYDSHRDEFREPERRRVAALVFSDKAEAETVLPLARKASPPEWGKLYQTHGDGRSVKLSSVQPLETLGDLGFVGPLDDRKGDHPNVPDPVRQAIFEGSGELGAVFERTVQADKKFYIIKLVGRSAAHDRTLSESERHIRSLLFQKKLEKAEQDLQNELLKTFPVVIDHNFLASVRQPDENPVSSAHAAPSPPRP